MEICSLKTSDLVEFVNKEKKRRAACEKGFILDGMAVRTLTGEERFPKLWGGIPPYNAQRDPHAAAYFQNPTVRNLLRKTGQGNGGTSMNGRIVDKYYVRGEGAVYLNLRNCSGSGHCQMHYTGHNAPSWLPMLGYNGQYGYRRNVPTLRQTPSAFGEITPFPHH
ncbi:uncharacterized protein C17orf98 homolog [Xenopus tropicalis]|uniref:Chromosome 17 open reading frame 98 n=1 Tax=Xenopus tropicalis TaxID=8364 RepID=F7E615_XENTR|nr:uncharacterized protein C17orf98 homolog [Xenopus tropicalis]XP_031750309.1 uncharacterized protein C17orf98 homolog [Xenopus tropicalis]XP_031750311.1 uncharacterized protein C17orf98 homolog [Xenopus tropicalis]